jgi:hypothetical protein
MPVSMLELKVRILLLSSSMPVHNIQPMLMRKS